MTHNGKMTGKNISHCNAIVKLNLLEIGVFITGSGA
jgi:hypothetical protein